MVETRTLHAATQSYRICRQKTSFSHCSSVGKDLLSSVSVIFYSTSLEMSQRDCRNCSQAGAFIPSVDESRGKSSQLNPEWHL